jgi:transposase
MIERQISEKEILNYMNITKDAKEYRRWHVLHLIRIQKMKITHAAKAACIARLSIYKILDRFDLGGPEGMKTIPTGGRLDPYMSLEEEKALIETFLEAGTNGLLNTAEAVKQAAEKKLLITVSIDYAYDLLHRHGWRKIKPRPKHPKGNKETQEEFKKKYHRWSKNA